ncbi:MAG: hypothetical protein ACKVZ0_24105 [Gemmatimonadales bacterium]
MHRHFLPFLAGLVALSPNDVGAQRIRSPKTGPSLVPIVPAHPIVEGQLYREATAAPVYLANGNQLFWIPTPDALTAMGFSWNVTVVPDGSLPYPKFAIPSASPTPPSLIHPPSVGEAAKLRALAGVVPGARRIRFRGTELHVAELRGWLRMVDDPADGCGDKSDFHYSLELDTDWALSQGIDLHQVLRVGNAVKVGQIEAGWTMRRTLSLPIIKLELNAFPRMPEDGGRGKPADWTWDQNCGLYNRAFPYNPLQPGPNTTLTPFTTAIGERGPYVRVSGSLVTDSPHDYPGDWGQWFNRVFGWAAGSDPTGQEWGGAVPQWAPGIASDDPRHPARWTEIHPVDMIEVLPNPPAPRVTVRALAMVARPGPNSCEEANFFLTPDTPRPSGTASVGWQELRGPETFFPWGEGKDGSWVTDQRVGIMVRARVCGAGDHFGSPGRFKALYRVWWR